MMSKLLSDKKKTWILISIVMVLTVAVVSNFTINKTPDFPCSQDPDQLVSIEDGQVPLAKIDTTSKTTKKTSTKKVKLKSASKKSYTKNLPAKTKTSTKKVTKTVSEEKVVTETKTIVKTTIKETYKKASKIKTVKQTVATTVNTTTTKTPLESAASESSTADTTAGEASNGNTAGDTAVNSAVNSASDAAASESSSDTAAGNSTGDSTVSNSTSTATSDSSSDATAGSSASSTVAGASADGAYSVSALAPKTDSRVKNAFETLGFEIAVNSSVSYAGKYDTRAQLITLKRADDTVYHELGHFLAFIAGNMDTSSSFKAIYEAEKSKYTGFNKSYVTKNSSEYFAESFKDYTLNPSALKKERPDTYDKIEAALELITDSRISKYKSIYAPYWK